MKCSIFILLLLLTCSFIFAQTWQRTYPWIDVCPYNYTYASADVYNVIPAIGGGYFMQGFADFSGQDYPVMLTNIFWKIDENGDVVWRKTYGGSPYNVIASNGVDRYYALDGSSGQARLFVFDQEMNFLNYILFAPQYGINNTLNDMVIVDDGIVFAGRSNNASGWFLMKIDFNYNLVWTTDQHLQVFQDGLSTVKETIDGGFIAVSPSVFAQFNAEGDTLWTCNTVGLTRCCDCLQTSDGSIYILGVSSSPSKYKIYRADLVSHSITSISDGLTCQGNEENLSLAECSEGTLVFFGHTSQGTLHKYNLQGEYIWSRYFIGDYGLGSNNMFCTSTGNIIFCLKSNFQINLVKADSAGNVVAIDDPQAPNPMTYLSHYPNPVHNIVNIKYDVPNQIGKLMLEIFNLRGQKVFSKMLNSKSGEFKWNCDNNNSKTLQSGVYIYSIKSGNNIHKSNKMIVIH